MEHHHYFHIVAASGDVWAGHGLIGRDNDLPWSKYPEDLKFFKATTAGNTVIMGRKTYESIGKPLPNRENIVLSRASFDAPKDVKVVSSLEDAMKSASHERVFIIGGAEIYRQTIDKVEGIYLTPVSGDYPGNVYYPAIPSNFKENKKKSQELQEKHKIQIRYLENTGVPPV